MYCMALNNENLETIKSLNYIPVGLKNDNFSDEWLRDNTDENITEKNNPNVLFEGNSWWLFNFIRRLIPQFF